MDFYKILQEIMDEKGMNIPAVARSCGLADGTVRSIFTRKQKNVALEVAFKISEGLGVSLERLNGVSENGTKKAPSYTDEALQLARDYDGLDIWGQRQVRSVAAIEKARCEDHKADTRATKIIPLISSGFAAGRGDPDFGNPWEDYEVPADSPAEFAIHISGDSMEPYLHDGSIALCVKRPPSDGEVGAFLLDGDLLCKQICIDHVGNVYLFSLNRERADADRTIWHNDEHDFSCFGTVLLNKRVPLP